MENQTNDDPVKKLVRKAFYATGTAVATVGKIGHEFTGIAKEFQNGFQSLNNYQFTSVDAELEKCNEQLESLYDRLGKMIYESTQKGGLSLLFKTEYELLEKKAAAFLNSVRASIEAGAPSQEEAPAVKGSDIAKEQVIQKEFIRSNRVGKVEASVLMEQAKQTFRDLAISREEKLAALKDLVLTVPSSVVDFVNNFLGDDDFVSQKALLQALIRIDDPVLLPVYQRFLGQEDPFIRLYGIAGLSRIKSPEAQTALLAVVNDPDIAVRRLVANCIDPAFSEAGVLAIVKLGSDPDEGIARIAVRKLGRIRTRFAFTHLISMLDSQHTKVRKEAIEALGSIAGSDLGYRSTASGSQRDEAVKRWQQLWKDNQMNPDFLRDPKVTGLIIAAPADVEPPEVQVKLKGPKK